jgi:hypothetical protein
MSTIGYSDWAVDLAEVGAIYPFQGWELAMTIAGVIFWLGWHRIQFKAESRELEAVGAVHDEEKIKSAIERY